MKNLVLMALVCGAVFIRPAVADEAQVPPGDDGLERKLHSGAVLTTHLVRSHSSSLLLRPVRSARNLLSFTSHAVGGLMKDTTLDAVLFPRLPDQIAPLNRALPAMDLRKWEQDLDRITGTEQTSGTAALLVDGAAFFNRLTEEIAAAESSIRIQTYIFDNDDTALGIADQLKARSLEIPVEVLVDGIGTWGGSQISSASVPAAHRGPVSIKAYMERDSNVELKKLANTWFMGDHTKSYIFDERVAFIGGMNVGREYRYDWHDLMVELSGPVVAQLSYDARKSSVENGWGDLAFLRGIHRGDSVSSATDIDLRLLYTKPQDAQIYRAQLEAVRRSVRYIYVQNAYLADDLFLYELVKARGRGVDVRVVVPRRPDSEMISRSNVLALNTLKKHGVRVYLYPGMTHVKAAIYDGWACLGTANFDKLSFKLNREVNVGTSDQAFVETLKAEVFERDFELSEELDRRQPVQLVDHLYEKVVDVIL